MASVTLRNTMKAKKPKFPRQQAHMLKQLASGSWNRPRGLHSKIRNAKRGKPAMPKIGYSSPKDVSGLDRHGKKEVFVTTLPTLQAINKVTEVAVLARTLGTRSRVHLLTKARELHIPVKNVKNIDQYLTRVQADFAARKKQHQTAQEKKKQHQQELEKKVAEKNTETPAPDVAQPAAPKEPLKTAPAVPAKTGTDKQ